MTLSPDERGELRAAARSFFTRESSSERVRATEDFDRGLWRQMVELGWTSIHVPESSGGAGSGYADLGVVLHELGRAITPSPFLASAVLATGALMLATASEAAGDLLLSIVAGESLGSMAFANIDGSYDVARSTTTWDLIGSSVHLHGTAGFVLDADVADVLVVVARHTNGDAGVVAIDASAAGVSATRVATVDATRRLFTVSFDDVVVGDERLLCEPGGEAEALLEGVLAVGVVAAACDATGVAERVLDGAAEYARERTQFGKPIGSFQAVKHHCANMAIAVEASRAAVRAGCEALDGDRAGWSTAAEVASSFVGPACSDTCALGLRVHGGIGFTWEHDSHLYLKRAKLDEVLFGTPSWHRRRLADAVFPEVVRT